MADMFGGSGKTGRNAAMWTAGQANATEGRINGIYDQGMSRSLASLGQARGAFNDAQPEQINAINAGADAGIGRLGSAADLYRPSYQRGEGASQLYADSLGINGGDGNARAVNSFQAGPGYQFQVDQATDAAARNAAKLGIAGSGNTMSALATLGGNLANQEYGGWQNRLQGLGQTGMQAAGGISSALTGMAGIDMGRGTSLASIYGQGAGNTARTYFGESDLYSNDAAARAGLAQNTSNTVMQAGQAGFKAGDTAAQNRGNLLMNGVKLGTDLLGSFMGKPPTAMAR